MSVITFSAQEEFTHEAKIGAARGKALHKFPYFSAGLFALCPTPVPKMHATTQAAMACSPNAVLYYDPEVITNTWTLDDVVFGLLHEMYHILRYHHSRCGSRNPVMWNHATDAAINGDLVEAGLVALESDILPEKLVDPDTGQPAPTGQTGEWYYALLLRMKEAGTYSPPKPTIGRPGEGSPCGGVSGNPIQSLEDGSASSDQGRTAIEMERVRNAVAHDVMTAEAVSRGCVPNGMKVWAEQQIGPPQIHWVDRLRNVTSNATSQVRGDADYTYGVVNRRQWPMRSPIITPALTEPEVRMEIRVDTSGSMLSGDLLGRVMGEVGALLEASGNVEVAFGSVDADAYETHRPSSLVEACESLVGGGGTDFRPIFDKIEESSIHTRPHILLLFTDGHGPFPAAPPTGLTTIVVLMGAWRAKTLPVDWAEVVTVDD